MRRFGLVGRRLEHSFSQNYFHKKFLDADLRDCSYENIEVATLQELPSFLNASPEWRGLNVTIPYKEEILSLLDEKNTTVQKTKACNCIKIEKGKFYGFNTDVLGFRLSLSRQIKPYHKQALILGSGGASKAVASVLEEMGIKFTIVSRKKQPGKWTYQDLDENILAQHLLIVNTTPLGMYPHIDAAPPIPYGLLTKHHFLFDLIYNPPLSDFLNRGNSAGAQTSNGYQMLVLQAEESWRIWNTH
ncbi:MAG: shikimate dehydrogenase [Flavisolibacter sp.]